MSYICLNSWDDFPTSNLKKEYVMEIKERIKFAHKAEGALSKHQEELKKGESYVSSFLQDKNFSPAITLE